MNLRKICGGLLFVAALASAAAPSTVIAADSAAGNPKISLDHQLAAFLETREFAAFKGATGEFTKMEGAAIDVKNHKMYIAITDVTKTMSDAKGDLQLKENHCGAVWAAVMDENWNITHMEPVVVGGPYDASKAENRCSVDSIANPDNLAVDGNGNLWIGEDTDYHENNYLWMYNGKELKRFATMPAGAEVSGLAISANGDLFLNSQHPDARNIYPYNRGTIGVVKKYKAGRSFDSVDVPKGDDAHRLTVAAGDYQVLGRYGEPIPGDFRGALFGQRFNADGTFDVNNNPDGNMFVPVNQDGTEGYLFSNVESRPAGVSKIYIRKQANGEWKTIEGENVDFRSVNGGWNFCGASVTPWNTGLTSEEYEPVVTEKWANEVAPLSTYLGRTANPYDYGYMVELTPNGLGTKVAKHYAMGRLSHELAAIAPDQKTAYVTDDHDNGVLVKFVADKAGDLSSGTLYAAKLVSKNGSAGAPFEVQWVQLGTGNDKEIAQGVRSLDAKFVK